MPLGGSLYYDIDPNGNIEWYHNYPKNRIVKTYLNLEPRLSLNWQTSDECACPAQSEHLNSLRPLHHEQ